MTNSIEFIIIYYRKGNNHNTNGGKQVDKSKIAQVDLAFEMYCKSLEYNNNYLKLVGSLNSEQLALLNVKLYNYLKEVFNIEK